MPFRFEIVDKDLFAEYGLEGLLTDTHNAMHQSLAPGRGPGRFGPLTDAVRVTGGAAGRTRRSGV